MDAGGHIIPPAFDTEDEAFALALASFSEIYGGCFANAAFLKSLDDAGAQNTDALSFAPVSTFHAQPDSPGEEPHHAHR